MDVAQRKATQLVRALTEAVRSGEALMRLACQKEGPQRAAAAAAALDLIPIEARSPRDESGDADTVVPTQTAIRTSLSALSPLDTAHSAINTPHPP